MSPYFSSSFSKKGRRHTSVSYTHLFKKNPPLVPYAENEVGSYRRTFKVPADWKGRRVVLLSLIHISVNNAKCTNITNEGILNMWVDKNVQGTGAMTATKDYGCLLYTSPLRKSNDSIELFEYIRSILRSGFRRKVNIKIFICYNLLAIRIRDGRLSKGTE